MMKKNKILTIISSIFGVFAICGAFCCSIIFGFNKKVIKTNAVYNLVGLNSYDFSYSFTESSMSDYKLYIEGNVNAYQLYDEGGYHYEYIFSTRYKFYKISTNTYYPIYRYSTDLGTGIAYNFVNTVSDIYSHEAHDYIPMYNYDEYFSVYVTGFSTSGVDILSGLQTFNIGISVDGNVNSSLSGGLGVGNVYCDILFPEYSIIVIYPYVTLGDIDLNIEVGDPYSLGYSEGYNNGNDVGYANGVNDGYSGGYDNGYSEGVESQQELISNAYSNGYSSGYIDGSSEDDSIATIFSNIFLVAMVPVDFFLRVLNWEILGVNIASFVTALISVAATVIVIRLVTGKKND